MGRDLPSGGSPAGENPIELDAPCPVRDDDGQATIEEAPP
jgi:hypothetical protein